MKFDCNCFTGNWPFFKVRCNTLEKLMEKHRSCGIEGGFVSALESIFYQDPYEAEVLLAEAVKGTSYRHAMILNPTLPGWKDDLTRAMRDLDIQAVRLVPGFHGYKLTDAVTDEVSALVQQYELPLIITARMRDERCMYMIQPEVLQVDDIVAFLEKNPNIITILAHLRAWEAEKILAQFPERENLFTDISGFKDGLFIIDQMQEKDTVRGRMVYGSGAPLMDLHATVWLIDTSEIGRSAIDEIYSGQKLLQLSDR